VIVLPVGIAGVLGLGTGLGAGLVVRTWTIVASPYAQELASKEEIRRHWELESDTTENVWRRSGNGIAVYSC
jgi:hypothetical protein